jgi:hypothetical protein
VSHELQLKDLSGVSRALEIGRDHNCEVTWCQAVTIQLSAGGIERIKGARAAAAFCADGGICLKIANDGSCPVHRSPLEKMKDGRRIGE